MEVKREHLARQMVVTGTVPAEQVLADVKSHFAAEIAPDLEIPGFRKGKAPRELAEKKLGANEMYRPVLDGYFAELVSESSGDDILAHGDFGFAGNFSGDVDVVLSCTVTLSPRVLDLDVDSALSAVYCRDASVSEDEVEAETVQRCRPHMMMPIADGTEIRECASATIDFQGSVNSVPFPGGSSNDFAYVAGETDFVPGFEEQLLRMCVGETGRISVDFPDDYPHENLAGQPAVFVVTVKSAQKLVSETPTDAAAASAGFESLDAMRGKIRDHLRGVREHESSQATRHAAATALSDAAVCETLSNDAIDAVAESAWSQFLEGHGFSEEKYIETRPHFLAAAKTAVAARFKLDEDSASGTVFEALCADEAVRAAKAEWKMTRWESLKADIRTKAVLGHVARERNLSVTEAEVAARLREISTDPNVLDRFDAETGFRLHMTRIVLQEKALDWVAGRVAELSGEETA